MEPNTPHIPIHERVTTLIQSGKVPMRSSLHFILKSVLLVLALLSIFVLSTIILNYIIFTIHIQSHHELLGFGFMGFIAFLAFFPWLLLGIDILLALGVLSLLRSFRFGYKTPRLYLGVCTLIAVVVVGMVIERMSEPMNTRLMRHAEERRLPRPLPSMMQGVPEEGTPRRPLCRCEVVDVAPNGMLLARDVKRGKVYTFRVAQATPYATTSRLVPGDIVIIAGTHDGDGDSDDVIEVYGLRKISVSE